MASLQDLLASKQPSELDALLSSLQGKQPAPEANSSVMPAATPTSEPTPGPNMPGPADVPPTPLSPQMLGLKMGPNSSQMPDDTDRTPASTDNADDESTPDKDNTPSEDEDDEDDSTPKSSGPVKVSDDHYTGDASDDQKKNLQDLFNNVHSLNTLRGAQDAENSNRLNNGLLQAANTFSRGTLGLADKVAPPKDVSEEAFKELNKNADAPVKNLLAQQEKDLQDPNSDASASSRKLAGAVLQKAGFPPSMIEGMSHDDIIKQFPQLTSLLNHKDSVDANRLKAQELHEYQMARLDAQKDTNKDKSDKKSSDAQDKALQNTKSMLESARGNPAAAQAEKDLYAAQKADSLYNRYKDPNKMNSAEVQLYATEIAKMASGGVPSIHELQGLNPATITSELAQSAQKMKNTPTPANAGDFLKRYKAYSDSLAKDAQNVISDKYGRVIESSKKQLGDDNYKSLQDQYLNRFNKGTTGSAPTSSGPHGDSVQQNGHTYNWNPTTGQYE